MLNFVVYSHSSYDKILQIQTDYLVGKGNLILIIDNNNKNLESIYSKYNRVIFYDDNHPYATRLINSLNKVEWEYFIFIHDIDILLYFDPNILNKLTDLMKYSSIDRIDLKYTPINHSELNLSIDLGQKINLIRQVDIRNYIYNVNPSIWFKKTFMDILNKFPNKTYRNIENIDVQIYCQSFNIYKINCVNKLLCGYFECVDFFKFFHISHSGKIINHNPNNVTEYNQSYIDVKKDFEQIIFKYKLE
jgi:hypothetical protein